MQENGFYFENQPFNPILWTDSDVPQTFEWFARFLRRFTSSQAFEFVGSRSRYLFFSRE